MFEYGELEEPPTKRACLVDNKAAPETMSVSGKQKTIIDTDAMIKRLKSIVKCVICHSMPQPESLMETACGHLICNSCFVHLMADGALSATIVRCPNCRETLRNEDMQSNRVLQRLIAEMPKKCKQCKDKILFKNLENHLENECMQRSVACKFLYLGCNWCGPFEELTEHQANCNILKQDADVILNAIDAMEKNVAQNFEQISRIYAKLNNSKSCYKDLKMNSFFSGTTLTFISTYFHIFDSKRCSLKIYVNEGSTSVLYNPQRKLSYRMEISSKLEKPMNLYFCIMECPLSEFAVECKLYKYKFTEQRHISDLNEIVLCKGKECNEILMKNLFYLRLWIFMK